MRALELIAQKRDGHAHSREDIAALIHGYTRGDIPDYQVSAWLMAVYLRGLNAQETADLTLAMAHSGDMLDLSMFDHAVDKHSTGGVGDKTSLVLAPLLAACGATVAKMSGRGLGHTGGTIDKLESIPGFNVNVSDDAFLRQARDVGVVICGQNKALAPADGLLYALRDVTSTVASLPLIASSIMSKKLAGGAHAIVLDVKVGEGAFMKTLDDARALAHAMIDIGHKAGKSVRAKLTRMSEPLGQAVGNALEVQEAIRCLKGDHDGIHDLRDVVVALASDLLEQSGIPQNAETLLSHLTDGTAYAQFERWIAAQSGDISKLDTLELAPNQHVIIASQSGYVANLDALAVGDAVKLLGGGRQKKSDVIDTGVGVMLHAKVGDACETGQPLATIYHRDERGLTEARAALTRAFVLASDPVAVPPLILESVG
jgi:pyrimidine-nucleoside phosphorylase/thymidine phosphorylase